MTIPILKDPQNIGASNFDSQIEEFEQLQIAVDGSLGLDETEENEKINNADGSIILSFGLFGIKHVFSPTCLILSLLDENLTIKIQGIHQKEWKEAEEGKSSQVEDSFVLTVHALEAEWALQSILQRSLPVPRNASKLMVNSESHKSLARDLSAWRDLILTNGPLSRFLLERCKLSKKLAKNSQDQDELAISFDRRILERECDVSGYAMRVTIESAGLGLLVTAIDRRTLIEYSKLITEEEVRGSEYPHFFSFLSFLSSLFFFPLLFRLFPFLFIFLSKFNCH